MNYDPSIYKVIPFSEVKVGQEFEYANRGAGFTLTPWVKLSGRFYNVKQPPKEKKYKALDWGSVASEEEIEGCLVRIADCEPVIDSSKEETDDSVTEPPKEVKNEEDLVNHPPHYKSHPSGVECIQITEHYNFCIGNAIKYLWRNGLKEGESSVKDLEKAIWYIRREIENQK